MSHDITTPLHVAASTTNGTTSIVKTSPAAYITTTTFAPVTPITTMQTSFEFETTQNPELGDPEFRDIPVFDEVTIPGKSFNIFKF